MSITKLEDSLSHDKMTCSNTLLEVDKTNLVIKALELMRTKTKMKQYFKVHLQKNIPMQAGLGGGSGNAATAMYAFNQLCGYPASIQQMQEWSAELGSDVSFFFSSGTAYCTGRGEEVLSLAPLPDSDNVRVLILQPRYIYAIAKNLCIAKNLQYITNLVRVCPQRRFSSVYNLKNATAGRHWSF